MEPNLKANLDEMNFFQFNNAFLDKTCLICISHRDEELYFRINKGIIDLVNIPSKYLIAKLGDISHKKQLTAEQAISQYKPAITRTFLEERLSELYNQGQLISLGGEDLKEVQSGHWSELKPPINLNGMEGIYFFYAVVRPKPEEYQAVGITEKDIKSLFSD